MAYNFNLEQFNGPLDLLLGLIQDQKLDISQVALATVTDQYLAYLEKASDIGAMDLADFLVVATKLLVIKSKLLLPELNNDEEDSAEELENQLKIYRDYLEASKQLEKIIAAKNFSFSRDRVAVLLDPTFSPPTGLAADDLAKIFSEIIQRVDYVVNLPQQVMARVMSLKEKISDIKNLLAGAPKINFQHVLGGAQSRHDVVVCFMALLELVKNNEIAVNQKGVFDEITIEKI